MFLIINLLIRFILAHDKRLSMIILLQIYGRVFTRLFYGPGDVQGDGKGTLF